MDETQDSGTATSTGPRVSGEEMRDVSRLRRSRTDRYVAGVAGGLGRHFDIDPTVVRVVLAVLTLFGGAGLLLYVAVWVFVPEDGDDRAPVELRPDIQKLVLVAAAVVAACIVFGTPFANHGWGWGFPLPLLVIGLVGLWVYTLVRRDRPARPPTWATTPPPAPSTAASPGGTTMSTTDTQQLPSDLSATHVGAPPPAWMPPVPPAYVPPPRPRRTGIVLFWPTLALIAIGLGTLGVVDVDNSVVPSAYVALALAITAVMLLVGAFVGRPGGLIALGIVGSIALGLSTGVEASTDWNTGGRTVSYNPTTAAGVSDTYSVPNGQITLDLRDVSDLSALDGRTIDLHLNAGEIDVKLPRALNAVVDAKLRFAGDVDIDGSQSNGFNPQLDKTLTGSNASGPTITLDIDGRVGQITVDQD
jgi:phage shock protein PspC (stress-responsive transcriptional regulator)